MAQVLASPRTESAIIDALVRGLEDVNQLLPVVSDGQLDGMLSQSHYRKSAQRPPV
jgi:hypothetical protein